MPSLGVRLYGLIHGKSPGGQLSGWPARPSGRVIWLHAPHAEAAKGFRPLIAGLRAVTKLDGVVVTCPSPLEIPGVIVIPPPPDTGEGAAAFLRHWQPDLGIWSEGGLRVVLLQVAAQQGLPMMIVDGIDPGLRGGRWSSRLVSGGAGYPFRYAIVQDDTARRAYLKAGFSADVIRVAEPLEEPSHILPVNEPERASIARTLGTRPVWLAVGLPQSEEADVAKAHLEALRLTHRLLLIVVPASVSDAAATARHFTENFGLSVACRTSDEELDEDVQVYLVDAEELGLWYRLAPVTYLGGTFAGPGPQRHPFEAADLGSAILHGNALGALEKPIERLQRAGGSRMVNRPRDLGDAVGDLLAPDRAARLALAAWGVIVSGAEATGLAVSLAVDLLEGPKS